LIKDVYYILGRTVRQDNIDYVFFKSNSGGMFIDKFTTAFPDTPWAFMYRDSGEILQSHWKLPEEQMDPTKDVPCARHYANPNQPLAIREVLAERNVTHTSQMTKTQYCAAHLAGISRSVLQEHERTGRGRFINYKQMPQVIWETLLPLDFGIALDEEMKNKMMQVTRRYSKGGKRDQRFGDIPISDQQQQQEQQQQQRRSQEQWTEDTTKKRASVSSAIVEAVQQFCPDIYDQLENVALKQTQNEQNVFLQEGTNQRWNTIRGIGQEIIEEGTLTTTTTTAMA
jgi:Skp family chaperone for outer membrane proteins